MSKRSFRPYTDEFNLGARELLKSSGQSAEQVERDLRISPGRLRKWQMKYKVGGRCAAHNGQGCPYGQGRNKKEIIVPWLWLDKPTSMAGWVNDRRYLLAGRAWTMFGSRKNSKP